MDPDHVGPHPDQHPANGSERTSPRRCCKETKKLNSAPHNVSSSHKAFLRKFRPKIEIFCHKLECELFSDPDQMHGKFCMHLWLARLLSL